MMTQEIEIPNGLRQEAQELYKDVCAKFEILTNAEAKNTLLVACRALTTLLNAEDELNKESLVITGGNGLLRKHPLVEVCKISRQGYLAAMKALELQWEHDNRPEWQTKPGRPPDYRWTQQT